MIYGGQVAFALALQFVLVVQCKRQACQSASQAASRMRETKRATQTEVNLLVPFGSPAWKQLKSFSGCQVALNAAALPVCVYVCVCVGAVYWFV